MPVRYQRECESGAQLLVWDANEDEIELLSVLPSSILAEAELSNLKLPHKRREFLTSQLAIRYLTDQLDIPFEGVRKDEHGKPYLVNSEWQMSITHSKNFIGIVMHPELPVGIDIEKPQMKMWNILNRLYSAQEIKDVGENLETLSVYWSAKEALYKLYGKRGTDFRENLRIYKTDNGLFGEINMPDHHSRHKIHKEQVEDYFLVWVV